MSTWNSRDVIFVTIVITSITVIVTVLIQNKINMAIQEKALSMSMSPNPMHMMSALGNIEKKPRKVTNKLVKPVQQPVQNPVVSAIEYVKEASSDPPPVGSGKRWTPL